MVSGDAIQRILLVVLVGTLWVIGYVVAPTLFAFLEDNTQAGRIAGRMFWVGALVELGAGLALLVSGWIAKEMIFKVAKYRLLLIMLVAIAAIQFGLNPLVEQARGTDSFSVLHGVSAFSYLVVSALGLLLVWIWEPSRGGRK